MKYVVLSILAAVSTVAAADMPWAGKWKMNPAKSDFGETTVTITPSANGEMQFMMDGQSYTFKTDGKDYPAIFGQTTAWKQIDANNWETIDKLNGKVLTTEKNTISADGKSLTVHTTGTKPDGGAMDDTMVFQRLSGGPGLAGKWKAKNYKSSSPNMIEMTASGADGMKFTVLDLKLVCDVKFDGKDYPCTSPAIASGWTMSVKKTGERSYEYTDKQNGKALYQATVTVSADGKTLTDTGSAVGVNERYKTVFDKQ